MEGIRDFDSVHATVSSALLSTTRSASRLASEDLPFHRSLDSSLGTSLDRQNARLLGLANRLLGAATADVEAVRAPRLSDIDAVESNWRAVVDVIDSLLERADTALDEFTGAVRRLSPGAAAEQPQQAKLPKYSKIAAALENQDIEKPQLQFEHVPVNSETTPFKPLLESKPHARTPLQTAGPDFPHPYRDEIERYTYPPAVYAPKEPVLYHPFESTTATFVDTEEALVDMLEELKTAEEIAIDLEHHDQRSYIGIVSLMQISTRDRDWIVDTLKPWRRKLQCLNEVFANPNIVKVLHGAYMDVVWLQRDLGLYLVGLFDTHYASRALGYAGGSLAFLLKKFANVDAQKQYQTADWRIRPLPQELFDYARSDTHYLLYIFDCMRNELIERSDLTKPNHEGDKIWDVLLKSNETALQKYEHPVYDPELGQGPVGWYRMIAKTSANFTKEQFSVFRAVHRWRDDVAREQDDSVHYVMPNHLVFSIARTIPMTRADLLAHAQPATQTLRLRAEELVSVIRKAKAAGQDGPEMIELLNQIEPQYPRRSANQGIAAPVAVNGILNSSTVSPANVIGASSALPLRTTMSSFWGAAFQSTAQHSRAMSTVADISFDVPLPPLTADVATHSIDAEALPMSEASSPNSVEASPAVMEDDIIVLRDMSRKRKQPDSGVVDGMATQSDEVTIPDSQTELERERQERKRAKKEAKRAKKVAEAANGHSPKDTADAEKPFDYLSAPSVLNPPRESREARNERAKKEKNPYAKAMDAPKGLPRVQKERAGRSMTYKS